MHICCTAILALHCVSSAIASQLRDAAISGGSAFYLSGQPAQAAEASLVDQAGADAAQVSDLKWTVSSDAGLSIPASVPGDLITDLHKAGKIGDPLYENNFLDGSEWNGHTWTYLTSFKVPEAVKSDLSKGGRLQLVFDSIKMGAYIKLNGADLGNATNQFVRYVFDIDSDKHLKTGDDKNTLEVVFDPKITTDGRYMACTGGWDWAPYTGAKSADNAFSFSRGIVKDVYLVAIAPASATIEHVVPQIFYKGDYPTQALAEGEHGGFKVDVRIHLNSAVQSSGRLSLVADWGAEGGLDVDVPQGASVQTLSVEAPAKDIKLWWPTGMGNQSLYSVNVTFKPKEGAGAVSASRRVGFRYFALVTGNDTDASFVEKAKEEQGSGEHGMYFRVNGATIWSRGANMIPMDELEGRVTAGAHRAVVRSAADGGMNTLRVWGGGTFLPDEWYDACDEFGVLVYHDMQYTDERGHSPKETKVQEAELRHQVRRLSAHPSIVIWDGCNECMVIMDGPSGIYAKFILKVVVEEDKSRSVWPSSPASGWSSGVHKLDSLPTGDALVTGGGMYREEHGDYTKGRGMGAVNSPSGEGGGVQKHIPIQLRQTETGPQHRNLFASEFGSTVMSSFESMSPTLAKEHWGLHAGQPDAQCHSVFGNDHECKGDNVMAQRNYPCDNFINTYFGDQGDAYFNQTGEVVFKRQLYQCMVAQALHMKGNIEQRRSQNQLGCLTWQLNEIWPTGGWGSLEYGSLVEGQVLGGRWKPLHYFFRRSVYADVMATCADDGTCFVQNHAPRPFEGACTITALEFASGKTRELKKLEWKGSSALAAGAGTTQFFDIDVKGVEPTKNMLLGECASADGVTVSSNDIALVVPGSMELPTATVSTSVATELNKDGSVDVEVSADNTAAYVMLSTLAQGRFSDNVFTMAPGKKIVQFVPIGQDKADLDSLKKSLRVEHLESNKRPLTNAAEPTNLRKRGASRQSFLQPA